MLVGQRISQIPPYGLQNYIAGILAALERICHYDRHGLFTLSVLILNFAMKAAVKSLSAYLPITSIWKEWGIIGARGPRIQAGAPAADRQLAESSRLPGPARPAPGQTRP